MRLRVVLFGTGSPLSRAALATAARRADVVAVVTPAGPRVRGLRSALRRLARKRAAGPLRSLARHLGVPVLNERHGLQEELRRLAPDLLCVASFPSLLRPVLLGAARYGAIGLHPSLLPRHRGPDPLFWTYFLDDEQAGVTLHWLDAGEDTGDILYQEAVPVSRGRPITELYAELAERGTGLLERALEDIPGGCAPRLLQDATRASREPAPDPRVCTLDWGAWSAERVVHVLNGVGRWYPLLADGSAQSIRVERARVLPAQPQGRPPGTLERCAGGFRLHCREGIVEVSEAAIPGPLQALRAGWRRSRRASG